MWQIDSTTVEWITVPRWSNAEDRFWENVLPEPNSGCWLWAGHGDLCGYGKMHADGWQQMAHRFSYQLHGGVIPDGYEIDHLCSVRCCVNPAHLEPVTSAENKRRTGLRGRARSGNSLKTHCKYGHPLSGKNLYVRPDGAGRDCMECRRQHQAKLRARRKGVGV